MSSLPDEIRKALERPDGVSEETMAPLASRYDEEVRAVNERLDEAVALLRKNLRSEAIQSANRRPNVMDTAVGLDFAERFEWQEILQFLGVPVPQQLDQDKVQQLNEAIVETQPIEELLKQHRKLAIARAPLNWRLKVLRRIAEVDTMNPIWLEDIENYESVRRKTLATEVGNAIKENDTTAIASLYNELTQTTWLTPPPAELSESLQGVIANNEYNEKLQAMQNVAAQLHAAFSEFNEPQARNLRSDWSNACNDLNGPVPAELSEEVEPALTWISELDSQADAAQHRNTALNHLTQTLDSSRDLATLRKVYANAQRFDEPVPQELEQRFRSLIGEIELGRKRKTQLKIVSVVVSALLVAGMVAVWQYRQMQQERVSNAIGEFATLIDDNRLAEATTFWDRLETQDPELAKNLELVSLYGRLENKLAVDDERVEQFNAYLEKAGSDNPADIDQDALDEAEKLAVSEEEKSKVFDLQQRLDAHFKDLADQHTTSSLAAVAKIRTELAEIEKQPVEQIDMGELNTLIVTLQNTARLYPRRATHVDAQINIVETRASALAASVKNYIQLEEKRDAAKRTLIAAKTLQAYTLGLEAYTRKAGIPQLEREAEQSLKEKHSWQVGLQSNELATDLNRAISGGIQRQEVQALQQRITTIDLQSGQNPLLNQFRNITSEVLNDSGNPQDALDTLKRDLSRLPLSDLVTVEAKAGRSADAPNSRFFVYRDEYLRVESRLNQSAQMPLQHVADADGSVVGSIISGPAQRSHVEPSRTMKWLATELTDRADKLNTAWGPTLISLTAELRERTDLDGLIKEELIFQLLQACANGNAKMSESLREPLRVLAARAELRQQWHKPVPPSDKLATVIEAEVIPALQTAYTEAVKQESALIPATKLRYRWIGFLLRDAAGTITGRINIPPTEAGSVYIMCAATENPSQVDILPVGQWDGDDLKLQTTSVELNAGRPLFMLETGS